MQVRKWRGLSPYGVGLAETLLEREAVRVGATSQVFGEDGIQGKSRGIHFREEQARGRTRRVDLETGMVEEWVTLCGEW